MATTASPAQETLCDRKTTCEILQIKSTKYWQLVSLGRLQVVRLGKRCTRVKRSSIDRLINGEAA